MVPKPSEQSGGQGLREAATSLGLQSGWGAEAPARSQGEAGAGGCGDTLRGQL